MADTTQGPPAPTWEQAHHAAMAVGERWPALDVSLNTSYPGGRPTAWTSGILIRDDARSEASARQLAEAIAELSPPRDISISVGDDMAMRRGLLAGVPAMIDTRAILVEWDEGVEMVIDGDWRSIDVRVKALVALPAHEADRAAVVLLTARDPDMRERLDDIREHDAGVRPWQRGVEAGLRESAVAEARKEVAA